MKYLITTIIFVMMYSVFMAQVVLPAYQGTHFQKATDCGIVTDYDGNAYQTVVIGNQCWMAENLKTTHNTGASWCYNNISSYCDTLGRLYTWHAIMDGSASSSTNPSGIQGLCPLGWHLPSEAEWIELENFIASQGFAGLEGKALKSTISWNNDGNGSDDFGFACLPAGNWYDYGASFNGLGSTSYQWTCTQASGSLANIHSLSYSVDYISHGQYRKTYGFSVRCIKDSL